MKYINFVIFFTVFFGVYLAVNYYIFIRGWQALPFSGWLKNLYVLIFLLFSLSFIISRFTGHTYLFTAYHFLTWIGSFWLAALLYLLMSVVLLDLTRLVNAMFHFLPLVGTIEYLKLKFAAFASTLIIVFLLVLGGHINTLYPRIQRLEVQIAKKIGNKNEITIVAASDIHLGTLIGNDRLEQLVNMVNEENPDLILLAGDVLDEVQAPILRENIGSPLKKFKATLGVYAIAGNHEHIGGINSAVKYIESLGIPVLRDTFVNIDSSLVLIGRDDIGSTFGGGQRRRPLKELVAMVDTTKPLILLDHQPYHLKDVAANGIDLQISGHTHNGQLWPFNYIVGKIFELSWGYKKIGNTHFYVSSGYGTWGPPVRLGSRPEIVVIKILGKKD
jgi:hypothetical protein